MAGDNEIAVELFGMKFMIQVSRSNISKLGKKLWYQLYS